ncbi:heterotrimeric G protein alpha subunit 4 [Desarmillaria tabescens]|uniref:Heterotrimeric G protein alpha subunit 4 n=1 Tax=Armillaria tabescens TaxID=1929756 RepID=A0AA39MME2_ARMTA|nr:heterotrimeric G protein alpha subunit 4 [Desarmillaria tabescens]KAK0439069.1 heterotrimeric G protein alpha subunit 4 [Desarmillaria tabescens]
MGICSSSRREVTDADKDLHRKAEGELEKANEKQVKVLLLGTGDSGKTTLLKQMCLMCNMPFSQEEIEYYRQSTLDNLVNGESCILDSMIYMGNMHWPRLRDGEPFPRWYYERLKALWGDPDVQKAWQRGNEAALPENLGYFFWDLDRLFDPRYQPTEQDIMQCCVRTIGITETVFHLWEREVTIIDVGGQRSERRKWIHCFPDVTSILFLVSLNCYDQGLEEDDSVNRMQETMTVWDTICHSRWFKHTSIILCLNKNDLFEKKIPYSDIQNFFPDFDGEPGDARAGRDYFKLRFSELAEREIYIHVITATDIATLPSVMTTVEGAYPHDCILIITSGYPVPLHEFFKIRHP